MQNRPNSVGAFVNSVQGLNLFVILLPPVQRLF